MLQKEKFLKAGGILSKSFRFEHETMVWNRDDTENTVSH